MSSLSSSSLLHSASSALCGAGRGGWGVCGTLVKTDSRKGELLLCRVAAAAAGNCAARTSKGVSARGRGGRGQQQHSVLFPSPALSQLVGLPSRLRPAQINNCNADRSSVFNILPRQQQQQQQQQHSALPSSASSRFVVVPTSSGGEGVVRVRHGALPSSSAAPKEPTSPPPHVSTATTAVDNSASAPALSVPSLLSPQLRSTSVCSWLLRHRGLSSAATPPPPAAAGSNSSAAAAGTKTGASDQQQHHHHHHDDVQDHHHHGGGELKGLYNMPDHHHHHGDGRSHLWPDGTRKWNYTTDGFHWDDPYTSVPKQDIVVVNGQKMIKGVETRPFEQLFLVSQANMPFWPRTRLNFWGNYPLVLKAEFLFFWIPTLIIWSLCIPIFTLLYMQDEAIYTTMTVKVIGRQWYWVYEVESPPADD